MDRVNERFFRHDINGDNKLISFAKIFIAGYTIIENTKNIDFRTEKTSVYAVTLACTQSEHTRYQYFEFSSRSSYTI